MTDSPSRDAIDRAVADHYAAASLDADALRDLRAQIEAATPGPATSLNAAPAAEAGPAGAGPAAPPALDPPAVRTPAPDRAPVAAVRRRTRWTAAAAGLAVVAVALLAWPQPTVTGDALAREIASSHVMGLQPDVEAASFDEARERLDKLDFAAVRPSRDVMPDFRTRGARYTRLGGAMGAEFQIEDASGRPCSLFQVRDDDAFRNVEAATYEIDGVRVRVWREAGLLMGLAESVS